jgi:hypothetical protein
VRLGGCFVPATQIEGQTRYLRADTPVGNVQRATFNSQRSMGGSKGRMVAGIWGQTRCLGAGGGNRGTGTVFGPGGRTVQAGGAPRLVNRHGFMVTPITGLFITLLWRCYWQCQYFFRGFEVGGFLQAAETKQIFPNPATRGFVKARKHCVFARRGLWFLLRRAGKYAGEDLRKYDQFLSINCKARPV